jgi:hypothetical protein
MIASDKGSVHRAILPKKRQARARLETKKKPKRAESVSAATMAKTKKLKN